MKFIIKNRVMIKKVNMKKRKEWGEKDLEVWYREELLWVFISILLLLLLWLLVLVLFNGIIELFANNSNEDNIWRKSWNLDIISGYIL